LVFFKELGVGLGVAVLIDATVVRAVLLPASMTLLGDWNWYLPRWLEWIPHVGPVAAPSVPSPATASGPRRFAPGSGRLSESEEVQQPR
jgi:uncharacterized membrane protein YdfJ with MMPL/SSD domain